MMMMKTTPESSSTGRFIAASLMGLICLIVFLPLISTVESSSTHQELKSRLLLGEVKTRRHPLVTTAVLGGRSTDDRISPSNWNTISVPGGGNRIRDSDASSSHVVCFQLQGIRHYCPPFPALPPPTPPSSSSSGDHEIDPRYGVEKRLVPSGPNPLHN